MLGESDWKHASREMNLRNSSKSPFTADLIQIYFIDILICDGFSASSFNVIISIIPYDSRNFEPLPDGKLIVDQFLCKL